MKQFLIAIVLLACTSQAFAAPSARDTLDKRPLLMLKTSALTIINWRSELSFADIGAELRLYDPITLNADVGFFYQSAWSGVPEYTQGFYTDVGLRYYGDWTKWEGFYISPQYRYQRKSSLQELDFTPGGLPYTKLTDVNRNAHFGLIMAGVNSQYFFDRIYFDLNLGLGAEYRVTDIQGLAGFEWEAIETGLVEGVKHDDTEGKLLPAYHFEFKIGFRLFE